MSGWDREGEKSTGLPTNFDFEIESAAFTFDAGYASGQQIALILEGLGKGLEDGQDPHQKVIVSIGKGWVSTDGGRSVQREKNDEKFFNENCAYMLWLNRVKGEFQMRDVMANRGEPTESRIWPGLSFHMERQPAPESWNRGGTNALERKSADMLLPTRFNGVVGQAAASTVAAGGGVVAGGVAAPVLRDKVLDIFRGATTEAEAKAAALSLGEVAADDALLADIISGKVWAETHAA